MCVNCFEKLATLLFTNYGFNFLNEIVNILRKSFLLHISYPFNCQFSSSAVPTPLIGARKSCGGYLYFRIRAAKI
jgi:hypothetical protein